MTHATRSWLRSAAVAAVLLAAPFPVAAAMVTMLAGDVEAGHGEPPRWQPLAEGDELEPGDRVRTGDDGRAEIQVGRATVRLYPNSILRVPADTGDEAIELESGTSLFDVLRGRGAFEVRTPEVVVSVKGTRFSVALSGAQAAVAVFRGAVGVTPISLEAAREVLVREGFVASGGDTLDLEVLYGVDPWDAFPRETLERVPTPRNASPPASRAALDSAREAAIAASRPEAVARAAERHAEVRERVEAIGRRRAAAKRNGDLDDAADRLRALDDGKRDAVADARPLLASAIREQFVEAWLNETAPSSQNTFAITYLPTVNEVLVETTSGASWQLTSSQIGQVLDGSQSLPPALVSALSSQGVTDPMVFAQQVMVLFGSP